ncbi:hypothetical protein ACWDR0_23865 [Streptomyces sp. NPDC003691]
MTTDQRRVYGSDHDDPAPWPRPGHTYAELCGGPLGEQLLDITGQTEEELGDGAYLISPTGRYGPGGRSDYEPREDDPLRWDWRGDVP